MAWLSFHELQAEKERYDALVRQTPDVDVFCSSAHWVYLLNESMHRVPSPLLED